MAKPEVTTKKQYRKTKLSPAKKKFAQVFAETDNATEAVRQAYPELVESSSPEYLRVKAGRLITNDYIQADIAKQKERMTVIANKAVDKLEDIIENGKEHNSLQASMYSIDQVHGRATQKIESSSTHTFIGIDLTRSDVVDTQ